MGLCVPQGNYKMRFKVGDWIAPREGFKRDNPDWIRRRNGQLIFLILKIIPHSIGERLIVGEPEDDAYLHPSEVKRVKVKKQRKYILKWRFK
jgi:hypothetical protein